MVGDEELITEMCEGQFNILIYLVPIQNPQYVQMELNSWCMQSDRGSVLSENFFEMMFPSN